MTMNERRFQQELHSIQQRMAAMSPNTCAKAQTVDPFATQLEDVKAFWALTQERFWKYLAATEQREPATALDAPLVAGASSLDNVGNPSVPPGLVFFKMFEELRSEAATLKTRVATLESDVFELEDVVSGLEADRFTPPGTTIGTESGSDSSPPEPYKADAFSTAVPELQSSPPSCFPSYLDLRHLPPNATMQQPFVCDPNTPHLRAHNAPRPYGIIPAPAALSSLHFPEDRHAESFGSHGSPLGVCHENEITALPRWTTFEAHTTRPQQGETWPGLGHLPSPIPREGSSDGVAFRDREIARMDEQLRAAQEALRASEHTISQYREMHNGLQRAKEDAEDTSRQWSESYYSLQRELTDNESRLISQEDEIYDLHHRLAEQNVALRDWSTNWHQLHEAYEHARADAWASSRRLREEQDRTDSEIERMLHHHNVKLGKLQDFCEEEGAVIREQERVIARGARLLEERDQEIEELLRLIPPKSVERRSDSLRDTRAAAPVRDRQGRNDFGTSMDPKMTGQGEFPTPWNRPRKTVECDNTSSVAAQASGDERERSVAAEDSASVASYRSDEAERHYPTSESDHGSSMYSPLLRHQQQRGRRDEAPRRPIPLPYRPQQNVIRYDAESSKQDDQAPRSNERREHSRRQPADGATSPRPKSPPGPMAYRRLASDSNLRERRTASEIMPAHKVPTKHHSMQGLCRGRLQAYVESDNETGGGLGGEV